MEQTPTEFPKFKHLPLELRAAIWKQAILDIGPRIVYLKQKRLLTDANASSRVRSDRPVGHVTDVAPGSPRLAPKVISRISLDRYDETFLRYRVTNGHNTITEWLAVNPNRFARIDPSAPPIHNAETLTVPYLPPDCTRPMNLIKTSEVEELGDREDNGYTVFWRRDSGAMELHYEDPASLRPNRLLGFKKMSSTPPILLACREAFQVASEYYNPAFSTLGCKAETYFNFELDTLFINLASFFGSTTSFSVGLCQVPTEDLRKVKNLALTPPVPPYQVDTGDWINDVLGTFGNVKHLTVVAESRHPRLSPVIEQPGTDLILKRCAEIRCGTYLEPDGCTCSIEDAVSTIGFFTSSSLKNKRRRWNRRIEQRRQQGRDDGRSCWNIPEIDYRVVLTSEKAHELEQTLEGTSDGIEDDSYPWNLREYICIGSDSDDDDSNIEESDNDDEDDDDNDIDAES